MTDREAELAGLSEEERDLAHRLRVVGEVLRAFDEGEREMSERFAVTLRAHLLYGERLAPHPTFARRLRQQLLGRAGARATPRSQSRHPFALLGAVVIATVILLAAGLTRTEHPSWTVPLPTQANLLLNLSVPALATTRITPTTSLVHPIPAVPYPGPIDLRASVLPHVPLPQQAYQLQLGTVAAPRRRRLLGIRGALHPVQVDHTVWLVAADGGGQSHNPLHSLAVSQATGEMIYHDRRTFRLPHAHRALARTTAVQVARQWLTRLGWSGRSMPLRSIDLVPGTKVQQVMLGWTGVGPATIEEATLWVTPNHSVIEARVWPPVGRSRTVPTRGIISAWTDLLSRRVPIVVHGSLPPRPGIVRGTLRDVHAVLILIRGPLGSSYLEPAYRFEGRGDVQRARGGRTWLSLVPGMRG